MKLNEIKEIGFYRNSEDAENKIIFEVFENDDEAWLKKDSKAKLLIDIWHYDYTDNSDRKVYQTNGYIKPLYSDDSSIDVIKVTCTKYKCFDDCGLFLVEDKPTYKEKLDKAETMIKSLQKQNQTLKRLNEHLTKHRLFSQRYLEKQNKMLEEKIKLAQEALKFYAETTLGEQYQKGKYRCLINENTLFDKQYIYYDASVAQQALEKLKEVKDD